MRPSILPLPAMTSWSAFYFCEVIRSYAFHNAELLHSTSDLFRSPDPSIPHTVEILLSKQDAIASELDTYRVDPAWEIDRLLKQLDRLSEKKIHLEHVSRLLLGSKDIRKAVLPVFDSLVGQFTAGIRLLHPDDWLDQFAGMGVMSYLNAADALDLCGMLDAAEALRAGAPGLSRKKDRAEELVKAAYFLFDEKRLDLSGDYFVAAMEEGWKP